MSNNGQFNIYCCLPVVLQNLQREHEKVNESLATANQKTSEQSRQLETLNESLVTASQKTSEQSKELDTLSNLSADLAKQLEESTTEAKAEKEALQAGDNILAMQ